jgi:hypothetical protein
VKSLDHIHICVLSVYPLRIMHSLVLSMARFLLSSHDLKGGACRHQGVAWFARDCKQCAALGMHNLPVDDEAHLLFSCQATAVVLAGASICTTAIHIVAESHVLL